MQQALLYALGSKFKLSCVKASTIDDTQTDFSDADARTGKLQASSSFGIFGNIAMLLQIKSDMLTVCNGGAL